MSIKEVMMYKTKDNSLFETQLEAEAYDYVLQNLELMNEVIKLGVTTKDIQLSKIIESIYIYIKEFPYDPR